MPFQPIVPTWLAWNNGNFTSPTALTDLRTGLPFAAGGLNLGDYFDATNEEAKSGSYTTTGTLYSGRYRFVSVDSGATAANVATGTIGYLRNGFSVANVIITGAGSGQTPGPYSIAGTGGYGAGAVAQVVIGAGGTMTSVTLLQGGNGYVLPPIFSLAGVTGGTPGTLNTQMTTSPNVVTSYDVAANVTYPANYGALIRPVVFLNSITPGNYGFVQELGVATVLGKSGTFTDNPPHIDDWIDSTTAGVVDARVATASPIGNTIGRAVDLPVISQLFKIYMNSVPVVQD
jgi:hypothetical protein